jgi:predicted RecA/RadA family phage recombinase
MANYVSNGRLVDYTPSADVAEGAIVVQSGLVGVALRAIPANTLGVIAVSGVIKVNKDSNAIAVGASVYWDSTNSRATATSTSNTLMGKATLAAAAGDANVFVRLSM